MYAVVAVAVGVVVGLFTGGRFRHVGERAFRTVGALILGAGLQAVPVFVHVSGHVSEAMILASYGLLGLFALRNLALGGMGVVALGLALNIVPIAVNGAMPVRGSAIVRSGLAHRPDDVGKIRFGGKHHLETSRDHLTALGDILPDWVFHEVLSFGDLVLSAGIAAVFVNLLRPARRRREADGPTLGPTSLDDDPPSALSLALAAIDAGPTVGQSVALARSLVGVSAAGAEGGGRPGIG